MNKYSQEEKQFLINLGFRIRETRKAKGMVQQEVAALCNSEKANLSRIESGNTNTTILTLQKIASVLQIPLCDLLLATSSNI